MGYETLLYEREGAVGWISLNRPERLNTIVPPMPDELEAAGLGLINAAVPFERLEGEVRAEAQRLAAIPASQLAAMKLIVNQAFENMGLHSTQLLGPILDGLMRNTPQAREFIELAEREGVAEAIAQRDGPFGDYSQADAAAKPDPGNVIGP
jgi:enoyl-CoA hydratase